MSEPAMLAPWIAAGASTFTTILMLIFGFRFNKRLEVFKAENSVQLKYLESQLSRRVHVDGIRFEKEFQVYQEVWAALADFQESAQFLRAAINLPTPKPEMRSEALSKFRETREALDSALGKNSPFVAKEVYRAVADLMQSRVVMELCLYKPEFSPSPEVPINREQELEAIKRDKDEIIQQVLHVEAVIRERIER